MLHQTTVTDPLTGAQFNDYEILDTQFLGDEVEDTKFDYMTQVCKKHARQFKLADGLDKYLGTGHCGVVGCEKPAAHNYYFMVQGVPETGQMRSPGRPIKPSSAKGGARTPEAQEASATVKGFK